MVGMSGSLSRRSALGHFASLGIGSIIASAGIASAVKAVQADDFPDVVLEWLGAWSSDDAPHKIASLYTPDGTHADIPSSATVDTPESIEDFLKTMFAAVDHFQRDFRTSVLQDNFAVVDQLFTAWPSPAYDPLFQVYAITLFEFDDTSILYSADYYDSGSILMQLGSIPAASWFSSPYGPNAVDRFCTKSG